VNQLPSSTELLRAWNEGDDSAFDRLAPIVYAELRALANTYLREERVTLSPTELVHELFLRMVDTRHPAFRNRSHFFGACAQTMRRILVDLARRRDAAKRGATAVRVPLDDLQNVATRGPDIDLIALDRSLDQLAAFDPVQARIVELRFFGGLELDEVAAAVGVSLSTVKREWVLARTWLYRSLTSGPCS
jgi:RNA polymerase sigma-70 factor, ECF subfamily